MFKLNPCKPHDCDSCNYYYKMCEIDIKMEFIVHYMWSLSQKRGLLPCLGESHSCGYEISLRISVLILGVYIPV